MSEENINRLSDEERKKIEARRERIIQEIAILNWELAGEPDSDDERILEEMELNSPEKHLDDLIDEKQKLEEELFKDQYYKEIYNIIRNADYKSYEIPKLLTDDISDIDMFNRKNKAIQVTEAICHDSIKSSFNVGIIGEWGTGKSTLLNMIKMEIAKKKEMIEVSYDASSYSEQDQIWQNFSKILFEKYEKTRMFPNLRYTFSKVKRSPKKYISILLVNIIICIIIFLLAWGIKYSFSINSLISKFSGFGLSVVGVLLLFSRIIYPFGKKLLETSIPLSKKVNNTFKLPSYVENLGTRERVKEELDILFDAWIPRKNQKVVIFVDELDRCSEKGIVQFFQSIQLFFETKK